MGFRKEIENHMFTQKLYRKQILSDYLKKIIHSRTTKIQTRAFRFKRQLLGKIYDEAAPEILVWEINCQKPCICIASTNFQPTLQIRRPDAFFKRYQYTYDEIKDEIESQLRKIRYTGDLKLVVKKTYNGLNIKLGVYVVAN